MAKDSLTLINYGVALNCLLGVGVSLYAYYTKLMIEQNDKFRAMCDFSENMSCTKTFKSE